MFGNQKEKRNGFNDMWENRHSSDFQLQWTLDFGMNERLEP